MEFFLFFLLIASCGVIYFFYTKNKELKSNEEELIEKNKNLSIKIGKLEAQASSDYRQISGLLNQKELLESRLLELEKYQAIVDVVKYIDSEKKKCAAEIENDKAVWQKEYQSNLKSHEAYKRTIVAEAEAFKAQIKEKIKTVEIFLEKHAQKTMSNTEQQAQKILGDYYNLAQKTMELSKTNKALENKIQGYNDEYLLPNQAILDDLIEGYEYLDAAQRLKTIKSEIKTAIKHGVVAECDYVEDIRKTTAIAFITNSFNSKADVHVSRLRHDNVGKLIEALKDDYLLLNNYGQAFRNARINPSYLALRIEELKWAALVLEFKEREREEQREIREQIREEEKARKEYERAIKEASKEEDILKKAYEKARKEFEQATDDQKSKYDQKMNELMLKLHEAEERNQRALSMAQQTRAGHVYVISNIGSFGDDVLKLGMTRRLEPMDRIRELGDASVPFTFDVHAMIYSEDAPTLEKKLHHHFNHERVNKVNYKKEFFRTSLTDVKSYLEELGIQAKFTLKAEALQYRESLKIELMPDEEQRELEDAIEKMELKQKDYVLVEDED
ncbi:DUF4041 domain-containing protein [Acinetobacter sp. ANC 4216]|uniref:DUF4041 domain-containing protein n=1 Tax=Acinetobacter sp. ANC 4216 TaxID=2529840 RepID=UPI00103EBE04|nr:DUF4041 domain-containing protein [Acinetobacter sp. ANC 4216]TCB67424.1 DUF4041 domain-containing protein [Acinetobacter sp. ANC 4216]